MNNILLYVSSFIILFSFVFYLFLIFLNKKEISKDSGIDVSSDMLNGFSGINVILSKGNFSYYDIKRGIVKLNDNCYYGKNVDSIAIGLIETGIFLNDKKGNKIIDLLRKIIPTLKVLYVLPIIAVFINHMTYNMNDSLLSLLILLLFSIISYIIIDIKTWILNFYLEKSSLDEKIVNFIRYVLYLDWLILIGEIVMIFRFILILFNINI